MTGEKTERKKSVFREYFELIAETAVFVFFVMTFVVQAFQIPTGSMDPTLQIGDFLLVNKFVYTRPVGFADRLLLPRKALKRHDIVVFKNPNNLAQDYVKRLIAQEGEKVEIKDKQVFVNDQPLTEPFKVHIDSQIISRNGSNQYNVDARDNFGPVVVPPGFCFVMGDNRDDSFDSRYWSYLPLDNIKGKPWIIYFSYRAEKDSWQKTGMTDRLKKIVSFLPKARWNRLLKIIS
jgi:signal peptidase I